jgi:hypothetical protein
MTTKTTNKQREYNKGLQEIIHDNSHLTKNQQKFIALYTDTRKYEPIKISITLYRWARANGYVMLNHSGVSLDYLTQQGHEFIEAKS